MYSAFRKSEMLYLPTEGRKYLALKAPEC